jgi:hypothetical protein
MNETIAVRINAHKYVAVIERLFLSNLARWRLEELVWG